MKKAVVEILVVEVVTRVEAALWLKRRNTEKTKEERKTLVKVVVEEKKKKRVTRLCWGMYRR